MNASDRFPRLLRTGRTGRSLAEILRPVIPLVTRVALGVAFVRTGYGKLSDLDKPTQFFASIGIPAPGANAAFIGALELVGGMALILGFATRLFGALLSATMIVAILTADWPDFRNAVQLKGDKGVLDVVPFAFMTFLGWLVAFGPGALSVDGVLARMIPGLGRANDAGGTSA